MYLFKVLCLLLAMFYVASKTLGGTNIEVEYDTEETKLDNGKKEGTIKTSTVSEDTDTHTDNVKKVPTVPVLSEKEIERREQLKKFNSKQNARVHGLGCMSDDKFGVISGSSGVALKCDAKLPGACGLKMGRQHRMAFKFTASKELVSASEKLKYHFCAKMAWTCISDETDFPHICSMKGIECPLVEGKEYVVMIDKMIRNIGFNFPVAAQISLKDGNSLFSKTYGCVKIALNLML